MSECNSVGNLRNITICYFFRLSCNESLCPVRQHLVPRICAGFIRALFGSTDMKDFLFVTEHNSVGKSP